MDCDFCKKVFSSKSNLIAHQKSAKYCLELQGKENTNFTCDHCSKTFTLNKTLNEHIHICKEKQKKEKEQIDKKLEKYKALEEKYKALDEKLREKEVFFSKETETFKDKLVEKNEYIAKLEAKIEKLEAKLDSKLEKLESAVTTMAFESRAVTTAPTTTTNTTTNHITVTTNNNVLNLSKEHVNKVLKDHLDYNVVYAGQAGFAKFVVDKMLKGPDGKLTYKCVDPSRQMFEFTDETGETVRDMRAEKLIQSLLDGDAIKIGLDAAAKGWNTEDRQLNNDRTATFGPRVNEYTELNRNNNVFRTKVSSLTT